MAEKEKNSSIDSQKMEKIVSLAKRRGFIYPGSEIYGGLANTYDYGPVGTELLRNIKNLWWKYFVQTRPDMVGLDGSIISHHKIWEASGHVAGFADAMVDCKHCKSRFRADHIIEEYFEKKGEEKKVEGLSTKEFEELIKEHKIPCPKCGEFDWTGVRKFNQLFPVQLGLIEGSEGSGYLRGETAQLIFTNFKNVLSSNRVKLPFGIAQQGKAFRNEITPGNSIFRTIEFEQAEIEYFFDPEETKWEPLYEEWKERMHAFVTKQLGIKEDNLRWRLHSDEERSFYSKKTEDLEYNFPFGFKELWGLAYRTDYDLTQHIKGSNKDLSVVDSQTGKKTVPHVIEPAVGVNRLMLMVLLDAYTEEDNRTVLKITPKLAPYKVAVFPLLANKPELVEKAQGVFATLSQEFMTAFDARGNIGKRYLAQDEIGTPWCVTVDFETLEDDAVTVRDRDTMKQERIAITDLVAHFQSQLAK
jgi:glycyl-tRNA synthetase